MTLMTYEDSDKYSIAILLKDQASHPHIQRNDFYYPLLNLGIPGSELVFSKLSYFNKKKPSATEMREHLASLLPELVSLGVETLYVADAHYFKILIGNTKASANLGYVLPCAIKDYEHLNVILGINPQAMIMDPSLQGSLDASLHTLVNHYQGTYVEPGSGIITSALYIHPHEHEKALQTLLKLAEDYEFLSCDIETFSLRFNEAGIGTIAFATSKNTGIVIACDYQGLSYNPNTEMRSALRIFFENYKGKLVFHNAAFDVKVIIATLFMDDWLDTSGLLRGLHLFSDMIEDTKLIAYLATNSAGGNDLSLKSLAQEFAGNWAVEEIKDIKKVLLKDLMQYNLVDALSTIYVYEKYYPLMVDDNQEDLYKGLFLDSLKLIIQLELTGMPMSKSRIQEIKAILESERDKNYQILMDSSYVANATSIIQQEAMIKKNSTLKKKQHTIEAFSHINFNPNSQAHLQILLFHVMGLPILDFTPTKKPATGDDTIKKLLNHVQIPGHTEVLKALREYSGVVKILSTFIPAFEKAISKDNSDTVYLHGSFNLGGTVSGRLSSSDPVI